MGADNQSMICERRTYREEPYTHRHAYAQILFPLQGSMEIETVNGKLTLKDKSIVLLPQNLEHSFYCKGYNEFLVVDLPQFYVDTKDLRSERRFQKDQSWHAIRQLLLENTNQAKGHLLPHLVAIMKEKVSTHEYASIAHIHEQFSSPITVESLASIEHFHPVYYVEWFKQKTGKTPRVYLEDYRIERAKDLLIETNHSIAQVGKQVGYTYCSTFSRTFLKVTGVTPTSYRRIKR
ncbi:AraC family transcriptional regulator [Geomicrobium sp. JCM 19055]|uniref:AraC family transcriptional regulator n=1 Tax=Geomicrobium sp. JCM 19055 TaxID=1460649 RepID=UPI00045ED328|nr:AraC family transcriptional regulator [Geomicrobium sp. JCM 19055]GAJ98182.1 transcriptional regulator, AraC family [Geomicrobium sp. JCM 19055]